MGDQVGLIVLFGVIVILVIGFIMVEPRRSRRGGDESDSLNSHQDETVHQREDHPEGGERSHLVGNPPIDTITPEGWGVAMPGEGAMMEDLPEDVHPDLHDSDRHRRRH
jgi:hypothetical protein